MENNLEKIKILYNQYHLNKSDEEYLNKIIYPLFIHDEFQKRMEKPFLHHSNISLGEHIIEDTILTYLYSKKYQRKKRKYNYQIELAVKISFLHDLYTNPWQNSLRKEKYFFNKHGFVHPLEAVINAYYWYPFLFEKESDAQIIIDGIIHHMFPLPVRIIDNKKFNIQNKQLFDELPLNIKRMINNSLNRKKLGVISFSRCKYKEGRIMSKADKYVSLKQIKNFQSFKALFTGKNKSIDDIL